MTATTEIKLSRKDFESDQEVRWCPGCGDYAILATVQRLLPELGLQREQIAFISGIGCSSRFPYYMETYGFHTIHGRAPAIATGLKLANPDLSVWVVTGDGDGLSIGGNHLLHVLRRNVDLQILMFNNRIYGLTKGQFSPTSAIGKRTPSTPLGSIDPPLVPVLFALGAGARFAARAIDTVAKPLAQVMRRAHEHRGASYIEILQNCPVFNDGAFDNVTDRKIAPDAQLWVEHGEPLLFGKDKQRGLRLVPGKAALEVVTLGEDGVTAADILIHDETDRNMAMMLAQLEPPNGPTVLGVLYCDPAPAYDAEVKAQTAAAIAQHGVGDVDALLRSGHTWTVKG